MVVKKAASAVSSSNPRRPGFSAWDVHGKWSLRASVTSGLSLQVSSRPRI